MDSVVEIDVIRWADNMFHQIKNEKIHIKYVICVSFSFRMRMKFFVSWFFSCEHQEKTHKSWTHDETNIYCDHQHNMNRGWIWLTESENVYSDRTRNCPQWKHNVCCHEILHCDNEYHGEQNKSVRLLLCLDLGL